MTVPSIEFRHLAIQAGGKSVVSALDSSVFSGQKAVIYGPSGTGKTTLLRSVLGFVRPTEGEILIDGTVLNERTVWPLRTKMSYVPQEADLGDATAREVLKRSFGFRAARGIEWDEGLAIEVFTDLGLEAGHLDQEVRKLSGGEKQRVAIASALMLQREIVLMDEPTSALDRKSREAVASLINSLMGTTVLMATHDRFLVEGADVVIDISEHTKVRS